MKAGDRRALDVLKEVVEAKLLPKLARIGFEDHPRWERGLYYDSETSMYHSNLIKAENNKKLILLTLSLDIRYLSIYLDIVVFNINTENISIPEIVFEKDMQTAIFAGYMKYRFRFQGDNPFRFFKPYYMIRKKDKNIENSAEILVNEVCDDIDKIDFFIEKNKNLFIEL